jgi:hypothetical protein
VTELPPIPLVLRTRLAHATLQAVADACGADILHIKGPAVDALLRPARKDAPADATAEERALTRISADADVLVRPTHLRRFLTALKTYGWQGNTSLYSGGVVEHSVDWWHPELGDADIHLRFPGIQLAPDRAFAELWRARHSQEIAHRPCQVPSREAQRLLLLLHAARNGGPESADVGPAWTSATAAERERVCEVAATLGAEVALAGATGHLDDYADRPEYDLWRLLGLPDANVFELWVAMVKAAPTTLDRARAILYAVRMKADRLELDLQRRATPIEVLRVQGDRLKRGAVGLLGLAGRAASRLAARLRTRTTGPTS